MDEQNALRVVVNIPFCVRKCTYCGLPVYDRSTSGMRSAYMDALIRELHNTAECFEDHILEAIYITGGTPTTASPKELAALVKEIKQCAEVGPNLEITIDTNPGAVGVDALAQYKSAGVNRFEIGLCTTHPLESETLIRPYGQNDIHFTQMLFEFASISNFSFDILYGIPGQTPRTFVDSIESAVQMSPAPMHMSLYPLAPIKGTPFYRCFVEGDTTTRIPVNNRTLPASEVYPRMYSNGCAYLRQHGFERYTIHHFAQPGYESRFHELSCKNADLVGIGLAAESYLDGIASRNTHSLQSYLDAKGDPSIIIASAVRLDESSRRARWAVAALSSADGFVEADFEARFGISFDDAYQATAGPLYSEGFIEKTSEENVPRIRLTASGCTCANEVFRRLQA